MAFYRSFNGNGSSSNTLPGAISPKQDFVYSIVYWNPDCEYVAYPDFDSINLYVGDQFNSNGDFYYNENGAVLNAYKLSYDEEEKNSSIKEILLDYIDKYPEYELELKEGEFPITIDDGMYDGYGGSNTHDKKIIKSNHILYIKNYQDFIEKESNKIK